MKQKPHWWVKPDIVPLEVALSPEIVGSLSDQVKARGKKYHKTNDTHDQVSYTNAAIAYDAILQLLDASLDASPYERQLMELAFYAGQGACHFKPFLPTAPGGRENLKATINAEIQDAVAKWRAANPKAKREPTAREVYGKLVMRTDRKKPGLGRFNTIYSEWRRSRKQFP